MEKFTRNISLSGETTIEDTLVSLNLSYQEPNAPDSVYFSFTHDNTYINGTASKEGIVNYNVSSGIISDEFMTQVEAICQNCLENYQTI